MLLALVAAFVLMIDAVSKALVVANMTDGESVRLLGGLIYFSLIPQCRGRVLHGHRHDLDAGDRGDRRGGGDHPDGQQTPFAIWAVCLGLVLGGAIGNLIDRIFRSPGVLRGHVVDFISVFGPDGKYFAVFNVADAAITMGGIMLVVVTLLGIDIDGHRVSRGKRAAARTGSGGSSGTGGGASV